MDWPPRRSPTGQDPAGRDSSDQDPSGRDPSGHGLIRPPARPADPADWQLAPEEPPAPGVPVWKWPALALLALYVGWLVFSYDYHFIDNINLAVHETGHLVFTPFGETAHFLGGTILQLALPAAFAVHFWRRDDRFGAGVCTIWMGGSLMYAAWYMADAQAMALPLVGGGTHDWNFLFSRWGILHHTDAIARFFHVLASFVVVASLVFILDDTLKARNAARDAARDRARNAARDGRAASDG